MPYTIGLGRDSPIPLETDPRKYEGLIVRHGQWVRWSIAKKCQCLLANNRPDPKCVRCRGSGWRYSFQETEEDIAVEAHAVDVNLVEAPYSISASSVTMVRDGAGREYAIEGVFGQWIKVSGAPFRGRELVYLSVVKPRAIAVENFQGIHIGNNIIEIGPYERTNPWARIPYDIVSVNSIKDANGNELPVVDFSVDHIEFYPRFDPYAIGERLWVSFSYMPPARIAVVNQNLSYADRLQLQEIGGDSMAIFPFAYKVSEMDTLTLWTGAQVRKKVLRKAIGDTDILPDLFVSGVLSLEDIARSYREGVHFVRWDRNTIRWISSERPDEGSNFSIEYMANVTYRVVQQMPNVRSSEDKRFPSRVAIKLQLGTTGSDQV